MIPSANIQEWKTKAPWPEASQIEQDLIISRALCDLFAAPTLKGKLAFRGGTAINKLLFEKPLRYSEDIDLVQTSGEPIGPTIDAVREALNWLGKCKSKQAEHSMHLIFKYAPENAPDAELKLKVEINTREHKNLMPLKLYPFEVVSSWHEAKVEVVSFEPEEIFGTKLRALLQRRKNRDLFDLQHGLSSLSLKTDKIIEAFNHYLALQEEQITRAIAEERMLKKLEKSLTEDIAPLLPAGVEFTEDDALEAFGTIWTTLITSIPGDSWKLSDKVIAELQKGRFPELLK